MDLPPFLLNQWLEGHKNLLHNFAGSTGPQWTLRDLLQLGDGRPDLDSLAMSYAPPDGRIELRAAIAMHHGVDPDWVVVTNGASEAFVLLLNALAISGGNVVLPSPAYPAFAGIAKASHLQARHYPLRREEGFELKATAIDRVIDRETILVVTNSPHNPTGAMLSHAEASALAGALEEKRVPLLVDEVFHPVYFDASNPSAASIGNVISIGDMSKALSLPGLRIGWIIDADPVRRERLITARSYFSLSSSPILEAIAIHALDNRRALLDRVSSVASSNLAALTLFMGRVADRLDWVSPRAGLLAFPWFRDGRDSRPFCEALAAKRILLAPGDCFGMPEHMRIGFGSQVDGFAEGLELIESELRG